MIDEIRRLHQLRGWECNGDLSAAKEGLLRLLPLIAVNEDANDMMRVVDGCVWN